MLFWTEEKQLLLSVLQERIAPRNQSDPCQIPIAKIPYAYCNTGVNGTTRTAARNIHILTPLFQVNDFFTTNQTKLVTM